MEIVIFQMLGNDEITSYSHCNFLNFVYSIWWYQSNYGQCGNYPTKTIENLEYNFTIDGESSLLTSVCLTSEILGSGSCDGPDTLLLWESEEVVVMEVALTMDMERMDTTDTRGDIFSWREQQEEEQQVRWGQWIQWR